MRRFLTCAFVGPEPLGLCSACALFYRVEHRSLPDAFLNAVYLRVQPGSLWILYSFLGPRVLLGTVIAVFILQAFDRFSPQVDWIGPDLAAHSFAGKRELQWNGGALPFTCRCPG
jgi:hypothetical protein